MKNFRLLRSGPWGRLALAVGLGLVASAAVAAAVRTQVLRDQYRLEALREQQSNLRGEVEMLRVEESALAAAERVEARARERGFGFPAPDRVIWIGRPDDSGSEPGPASLRVDIASRGPR
ncbi:MAG: cell division protein FtsL [Myxococcales bacterium]|nr:cell division protein FtsL [Myxococcales bacterium]